jgi:hypothetical protein
MAGCDVLYHDPTQAVRDPAGHALGPASDGWQPCTAPGRPGLTPSWSCAGSALATGASWSPCMPPAWPSRPAGNAPA